MKNKLFVFDIETIPDLTAAKNLLGEQDNLKEALKQYHLDLTDGKNDFIRQPFHQVVAISFLEAEIHQDGGSEMIVLQDIRSGGNLDTKEPDLIKGFFTHLKNADYKLVSFNGRTFDLPVLKYRAMVYGVQAPWLYKTGDKWNNYNSRYSTDWHCDLLDIFSDYGASARIKMDEVCAAFGLPGKIDVDGSQVDKMFNQGKLEDIRNYCETDVINTYLLYLKHRLFTGFLNQNNYNSAVEDLISFIDNHKEERPYLNQLLEKWLTTSRENDGKITIK